MTTLQMYDPFAETGFDDLFRGFFRPVRSGGGDGTRAAIRVDVTESDNGYTVHAEVPGVKKDEIHVGIEGNQVTIAAEVKREFDAKEGERVLRTERYFGSVYRSFTLPAEIDEASSTAKYDNGVLELKLAKKPAAAGRKLTVQ
jgi:HSP20 family protein